jgi:cytoskeletal protein RodZ
MNQKLIGYIVIGVVAAALVAGVVAAAYWMQSQNTPDIVVNPAPSPTPAPTVAPASLTITPDKTSLTVGEILTLTSTVSDGTSGLTIIFYNQQNNPVGTATTDASGTATIQIIPPVGTWQYYTKAEHT